MHAPPLLHLGGGQLKRLVNIILDNDAAADFDSLVHERDFGFAGEKVILEKSLRAMQDDQGSPLHNKPKALLPLTGSIVRIFQFYFAFKVF